MIETLLTASEKLVYRKLLAGDSNQQIAADLDMTPKAVKSHLTNVFRKYRVKSRAQLIAFNAVDEISKRDKNELKKEIEEKYKYTHKSREDIVRVWPDVVKELKLHKDSELAQKFITELLLKLGV
jgi:DNA-binding CsgD family transcriptional regulator